MTPFLTLLAAYFLSQFYRAFLAVVAGDLSRDLSLGPAELGIVSSAWFTAFALAQFPVGYWLDRVGPRRTVAGLMVIGAAGAVLFAAATGFFMLTLAMALIGIGCSPVLMGALVIFARSFPIRQFAVWTSFFIGLGNVGNLAAATPLAWAAATFGWRASMLVIAALTLLSALIVALLVRDPPRVEAPAGGDASLASGLAAILRLRALWPLLPLTFISYAVVAAERALWIAPFLGEVHGFSPIAQGNGALVMAAAMALGAILYGPAERAIGAPKPTVAIGCALTGAAFLLLAAVGAASAALTIVLLAAIGAIGLSYGVLMAHARLFFPPHLLGRGVTFINFAFIAGAGLLQPVSGSFIAFARSAGYTPASTFALLHAGFGAMLLAATAIYLAAPARPSDRT